MNPHPTKIELAGENRLRMTWSDEVATEYTFAQLRAACPCASCKEKHGPQPPQPANLLTVLKPAEAQPLKITGMEPVGNYAYSIQFSDGHDTGIYTLDMLRELGEAKQE
jgi:DUF971 family protein